MLLSGHRDRQIYGEKLKGVFFINKKDWKRRIVVRGFKLILQVCASPFFGGLTKFINYGLNCVFVVVSGVQCLGRLRWQYIENATAN